MHRIGAPLAIFLVAAAACRVMDPGLPDQYDGAFERPRPLLLDAPAADAPADAAPPDAGGEPPAEEAGIPGDPAREGCADGTREGFTSERDWPDIAGCSGAWSVGGLLGPGVRDPMCMRQGGNDGQNTFGDGCGVADLCAAGWHVCRDAADVRRCSASGCESAVEGPAPRFFLTLAGASPQGICSPDRNAANDVHGCGNFGQPESAACDPLNRRLTFAECQASQGIWSCGGPGEHLIEAALVSKSASPLGGVLCCRDQ